MRRTRLAPAVVFFGLMLASCSQPATVATSPSTTASSTVTTGSTAATPEERVLNTVSCDDVTESMEIVCEAYDLIQTHYVDDVADTTLAEAAGRALEGLDGPDTLEPITCALPADSFEEPCGIAAEMANDELEAAEIMVAGMATFALDANSAYFDEEALANLVEEQGGEIEGIGALVSPEDRTLDEEDQQCSFITVTCRIYIVSTIKDTPAEAAGLQRDDVIVGVNGESVIGWTIDEVTAQVRGPAGTEVLLTMERAGEIFDVSIVRAAVVIPVIESEQIGETGYVQLRVFSDNADEQFAEAVTDLLAQGIDELVVDLRDNPGGLLTTAIEITSAFVADGDVVVTQSPDDSTTYPVTGAVIVPADVNVVFVVNKGSASASEVISATLQERGRVTVVGENTFGKNTVQQRFALSNGGALKLTIARWLTPGGLDFGGLGVTPDIPLDLEIGLDPAALVEAVHAAA